MPKLNDREREAIQNLTQRQLEALASATLGKSPRRDLDDQRGTRSNMGGAVNRMVDNLKVAGLLDRRGGITYIGVDGVLLNIARVPERWREEVKAAALQLQPRLHQHAQNNAEQLAAEKVRREEAAEQRKAGRNAAILEKLPKLAEECGLMLYDLQGDPPIPLDPRMLKLWDAIVNADAAL